MWIHSDGNASAYGIPGIPDSYWDHHRIHQYNISNCGGEGGGYVHHITATDGLSERSGPGTGYSVKRSLPYPSTISVTWQTTGTNVSGGNIWDQLTGGGYVSDYWVDAANFNAFSPPTPACR